MAVVRPAASSIPKNCPSRGLRRSQETIRTFCPAWAKTAPRLASVEVLPSEAAGLVTRMVRSSCSARANCSEVRSDRKASVAGDEGRARDTTSGRSRLRHDVTIGTAASTGALVSCSAVSLADTASSRLSRRNAAARPRIRPASRPRSASCTGLGELGDSGAHRGRHDRQRRGLAGAVQLQLGELDLEHGLLVHYRVDLGCGAALGTEPGDLLGVRGDLAADGGLRAQRGLDRGGLLALHELVGVGIGDPGRGARRARDGSDSDYVGLRDLGRLYRRRAAELCAGPPAGLMRWSRAAAWSAPRSR